MVRIEDIVQIISTSAGILALVITLILAFFVVKSGVLQSANTAQTSAIGAMRSEIDTLRERIVDAEKENTRLKQTIETICAALKLRDMMITIQGEMINIADKNGSTTAKIHNDKSA